MDNYPLDNSATATARCLVSWFERLIPILVGLKFSPEIATEAAAHAMLAGAKALLSNRADHMKNRRAWLCRVAFNAARRLSKREKRRKQTSLQTDCPAPEPLERNESLLAIVRAEVAALPELQRRAIETHIMRGMSLAQAALETGIPQSTFRFHLARGKIRLAEALARKKSEN